MRSMGYFMMMLVSIHLALFLVGIDETLPTEAFLVMVTQPENWGSLTAVDWVQGIFLGVAGAMFIATLTWIKSEFPIYALIATSLLMSSFASFVELYQYIVAEHQTIVGTSFTASPVIISIFFLPIAVAWIFTILEFARGRD